MRETATLNRPSYRSAPPAADSPSRRLPVNQAVLVLVGLFIVGIGLGWGVTRLLPSSATTQISMTEYTALVAQLFQHDHNTGIARERLALFGSPTELAQQAAQSAKSGKLSTPGDSTAVDALVAALTGTSVATGSNPDTVPTATSDSLTTAPTSTDRPSWLGPVLAFAVAFGLGIVVLLRTAGLSLSFVRLPSLGRLPSFGRSADTDRPARPVRRSSLPGRFDPEAPRHTSLSISEASLSDDDDDEADYAEDFEDLSVPPPVTTVRTAARSTRKASGSIYQSTYRLGDDPFDEIHPISDPSSGGLIAACGLSSALKFDSQKVGGYYAFTAWIQDYGNAEELHAAGLVAPGAPEAARGQIESWVRGGQIDTVVSLEVGASTLIGSPDLAATVTVVDVEFGLSGDDQDSYVSGLVVKFEVQRRVEQPVAAPRELARARR